MEEEARMVEWVERIDWTWMRIVKGAPKDEVEVNEHVRRTVSCEG